MYWWIRYSTDAEAAVITILSGVDKMKAKRLRLALQDQGLHISRARFYALMAKLVDEGCVDMWHEPHKKFTEVRVYWYKLIQGGVRRRKQNLVKLSLGALLPQPTI